MVFYVHVPCFPLFRLEGEGSPPRIEASLFGKDGQWKMAFL